MVDKEHLNIRSILSKGEQSPPSENLTDSIMDAWKADQSAVRAITPLIPKGVLWVVGMVLIGIIIWTTSQSDGFSSLDGLNSRISQVLGSFSSLVASIDVYTIVAIGILGLMTFVNAFVARMSNLRF
jgi:hypothetical protein